MPAVPSSVTSALPSASRERLPALALLVLAVALVVGSGWLVYADFQPDYSLSATPVDDASATDAEITDFRDLPPEAKTAFENARDGGYVVHHEPAWQDTFPLFEEVYVRADGEVYRVWARNDGLRGFSLIIAVPAVLLAVGLVAVGARSYRRENVRTPLTILAALGAGLVVNLAWPVPGELYVVGVGVGSGETTLFAVVTAGVGTWLRLGRKSAGDGDSA